MPAMALTNVDVKNAAAKIILDVQRLSGLVKESHLAQLPEKTRETLLEKIAQVECEPEANQKQKAEQLMSGAQTSDVLKQMQDAASFLKIVNIGESEDSLIDEKVKEMKKDMFTKNRELVAEKASSKDWQVKEEALTAMLECFESATDADI